MGPLLFGSVLARVSSVLFALPITGCALIVSYPSADDETGWAACADGRDNDFDGLVDCADPGCADHCLERSRELCTNGLDDDGDGVVDQAEVSCWREHATILLGDRSTEDGTLVRCSSRGPTRPDPERLGSAEAWLGEVVLGAAPDDASPVLVLSGAERCPGESAPCRWVSLRESLVGDLPIELELDVVALAPEGSVELVLAEVDRVSGWEPGGWESAIRLRAERSGAGWSVIYEADGRTASTTAFARDSARLSLRLSIHALEVSRPHGPRTSAVIVAAADDGEAVIDAWADGRPLYAPLWWQKSAALALGARALGTQAVGIAAHRVERAADDPCGYRVPQLPGGSRVLAAAWSTRRGSYCAIGTTGAPDAVEARYDPLEHLGWPAALSSDVDPAASARFTSFRSAGEAPEPVHAVWEQSSSPPALPAPHLRAAAMAWADDIEQYEAILLVSDEVRHGGTYVRARSRDCLGWEAEVLDELGPLAAFASTATESPVICVFPVPEHHPLDVAVPVSYRVTADGSRRLVAVQADWAGARIQPEGENQCRYPRQSLAVASWPGASEPLDALELGDPAACMRQEAEARWCVPAYPPWRTRMGAPTVNVGRFPGAVRQMVDSAGARAFAIDGERLTLAIQDMTIGAGAEPALEYIAHRLELLGPADDPAAFDSAAVREPLLALQEVPANPRLPVRGLLFYRGYRSSVLDGDIVRLREGAAAAVPIEIHRLRSAAEEE